MCKSHLPFAIELFRRRFHPTRLAVNSSQIQGLRLFDSIQCGGGIEPRTFAWGHQAPHTSRLTLPCPFPLSTSFSFQIKPGSQMLAKGGTTVTPISRRPPTAPTSGSSDPCCGSGSLVMGRTSRSRGGPDSLPQTGRVGCSEYKPGLTLRDG